MPETNINRVISIEEIHLASDAVHEMMETPPHWLIRSGIMMIGLVMVLALLLSMVVRYPEQLSAKTTIISTPAPHYLPLPKNAVIAKNLVADEQMVFAHQQILSWYHRDQPEKTFKLKAPVAGRVFRTMLLEEGFLFEKQTDVFLLVTNNTKYKAGIFVSEKHKDKLKIDQQVSIELPAYAHEKYGFLHTTIQSISKFANEHGVWVELVLPEKLITDRNFELPFQPAIQGNATVTINNKRIIERLFAQISGMLSESNQS